jgi:class 3 adenylate cyclase
MRRKLPSGDVTFLVTDIEGSTRLFKEIGLEFGTVLQSHNQIVRNAVRRNNGAEVKTIGDGFLVAFQNSSDAVRTSLEAQLAFTRSEWPEGVSLGDGFFDIFQRLSELDRATLESHLGLTRSSWPEGVRLKVRMGLHRGVAEPRRRDYVALAIHQAHRITKLACGEQVIASETVRESTIESMPRGATWISLGFHHVRDVEEPMCIYQLQHKDLRTNFPPLRSE